MVINKILPWAFALLALVAVTNASAASSAFPATTGNVFSIQYRNSTGEPITVWLNWAQPPCSKAQAENCNTNGWLPSNAAKKWKKLSSAFKASGTVFQIISKRGTRRVSVANRIDLKIGETLRIVPPMANGNPEWYWSNFSKGQTSKALTAGVNGWVTKQAASMPASMQTTLYEYNLTPGQIWWDMSAVDGINTNATMALEGAGCGADCGCGTTPKKQCLANIASYTASNDGCPYIMVFNGANTCPNPKFYSAVSGTMAPWVVDSSQFTTDDVSNQYAAIWQAAGSPTGTDLASAASGNADKKKAYHIWWATNTVATSWLKYLQHNSAGSCDAYGWAYDEMTWHAGDSFDQNGNPVKPNGTPDNNTVVNPLLQCSFAQNTYLNIDVLKVM